MKKTIIQALFISLLLPSAMLLGMEEQQQNMGASQGWELVQQGDEQLLLQQQGMSGNPQDTLPLVSNSDGTTYRIHVPQHDSNDEAARLEEQAKMLSIVTQQTDNPTEQAKLLAALTEQKKAETTLPQAEPAITFQDLMKEKWNQTSGGKKALWGTGAAVTIGLIGIGGYYFFGNK